MIKTGLLLGAALWTLGLSTSVSLGAAEKTECKKFNQPVKWTVCLSTPEGGGSGELLYHFHGAGGSARDWSSDEHHGAKIRLEWEARGIAQPQVAAISFGEVWLLAEKNSSPASALLETLVSTVIPEVEKLLSAPPKRRLLMGESMGGFNASQLVLKHPGLFARVVLGCPAIPGISPFATESEIEDFVRRTGGDSETIHSLIEIVQHFFPTEADWQRSSPLGLAPGALGASSPALHVSCGKQDEMGFFEGAERFARIAKERGVAEVQWEPLEGRHCTLNPKSIAEFLIHDDRR